MKHLMKTAGAALAALSLLLNSCGKKEERLPAPDEPELITTLSLRLTPDNGPARWFTYRVRNGAAGTGQADLRADTIRLPEQTTYQAAVFLYNEAVQPAKDITPEIRDERNTHLFYYEPTDSSGAGGLRISALDRDGNGEPFGQTSTWLTGAAGTGGLRILLIHGPRRKAGRTPAEIAGSTDVEAVFPVVLD